MDNTNKAEFIKAFFIFAESCGVKDVKVVRAEFYFQLLSKYDLEVACKGLLKASGTHTISNTLPLPALIIEAIEGSKAQIATTAYDLLVLSGSHSNANLIVFDDPALDCAIETLGGLPQCWQAMTGEYAGIFRKDFEKYFTAHKRSNNAPRQHYHDTGATLCETRTDKGMKPCVSMVHVRKAHQNRKDFVWISDRTLGEIVTDFTGRKMLDCGICEDVQKLIKEI